MNRDHEAREFDRAVTDKVAEIVDSGHHKYISEENVLRYRHGSQWSHVDATAGTSNAGTFVEHSATFTVSIHRLAAHDTDSLAEFIIKMAREMHSQFATSLFTLVNDEAAAIGNVVAVKEKASDTETDDEMLAGMLEVSKRMELGVNRLGAVTYPSLFVHPSNRRVLDLIGKDPPLHIQREVDQTNHRKELEAISREVFRLSRYRF